MTTKGVRAMSETTVPRYVTVRYRITTVVSKRLLTEFLADNDRAPVDDLDALADWLENNPDAVSADLGSYTADEWQDSDTGTVEVIDVEPYIPRQQPS